MISAQIVVIAIIIFLFITVPILMALRDSIISRAMREGYEAGIQDMADLDYNMEKWSMPTHDSIEFSEDQLRILSENSISHVGIWRSE